MKKFVCLFILLFSFVSCTSKMAEPNGGIERFYKVDEGFYRSGQPDKKGMQFIESQGIKSVLNLRNNHSDDDEAKGTSLKLYRVEMNAGSISDDDIIKALKIIKNAEKPLLVHCWHGSDRTGTVVAMYRIVFQNWTKEKALNELLLPEYGHHKTVYKNIPAYINNVDIKYIKEEVFK